MEKITLNANEKIEINGAVLTPEVLSFVQMMQHDDNGVLKEVREELTETIFMLIRSKDEINSAYFKEVDNMIMDLNRTCRNLKNLAV